MRTQITVGDSQVILGEAPDSWQPMPGFLYVYVTDVDAIYDRALAAELRHNGGTP